MLPVRTSKEKGDKERERPANRKMLDQRNNRRYRPRHKHQKHTKSSLAPNLDRRDTNDHPGPHVHRNEQQASSGRNRWGPNRDAHEDREHSDDPTERGRDSNASGNLCGWSGHWLRRGRSCHGKILGRCLTDRA